MNDHAAAVAERNDMQPGIRLRQGMSDGSAHVAEPSGLRVAVVKRSSVQLSETFIRAHVDGLPGWTCLIEGEFPHRDGRPVVSRRRPVRLVRFAWEFLRNRRWNDDWERTAAYRRALARWRIDVVLAEYGPSGVAVMQACRQRRVPLVVHFHGYDATRQTVLNRYAEAYRAMWNQCAAVVAVSRPMRERLLQLGVPADRVHVIPCGVDAERFQGAQPGEAPPILLAVGRFTEKKAPHLTIRAMADVVARLPEARLRMIGDGPLWETCRQLASQLGIAHAVEFLGAQPHGRVLDEMRRCRGFVQHSVTAEDGDCEGTPVAVTEAAMCGLPVVSTRHGGIPDVVEDGSTGFLTDERNVAALAETMFALCRDPALAAQMGRAAREKVRQTHASDVTIGRLWRVLQHAAGRAVVTNPDVSP